MSAARKERSLRCSDSFRSASLFIGNSQANFMFDRGMQQRWGAHSAAQTLFALHLLLFEIPLREFCVDWKMQSEWRGGAAGQRGCCRAGACVKSNMVYSSVRTWYTTHNLVMERCNKCPSAVSNSAILKLR